MKNIKWIALLLFIVLAYFGYNYIYQDHRDISKEAADFKVASSTLLNAFKKNTKEAEAKYLNHTIIVTGQLSEINTTSITIDHAIFCGMTTNIEKAINKNTNISIKGRCIGYDDLLEQVKLDQCSLIN